MLRLLEPVGLAMIDRRTFIAAALVVAAEPSCSRTARAQDNPKDTAESKMSRISAYAFSFPALEHWYDNVTPAQRGFYLWDPPEAKFTSEQAAGRDPITLDDFVDIVEDRFPERTIQDINPPTDETGVYSAWVTRGFDPWTREGGAGNTYVQGGDFTFAGSVSATSTFTMNSLVPDTVLHNTGTINVTATTNALRSSPAAPMPSISSPRKESGKYAIRRPTSGAGCLKLAKPLSASCNALRSDTNKSPPKRPSGVSRSS